MKTGFEQPFGVELGECEAAEREIRREVHRWARVAVVERGDALQPDTGVGRILRDTDIVEEFQCAGCDTECLAEE
jgi:hypothetical protein